MNMTPDQVGRDHGDRGRKHPSGQDAAEKEIASRERKWAKANAAIALENVTRTAASMPMQKLYLDVV
jgi:hypothetical protein